MAILIDDIYLPATLSAPPMTDEDFADFCSKHPDLFFEMTAEGEIIAMAPTYSDTGAQCFDAAGQLREWARKEGSGVGCDSSTGFHLPNGARLSPDASWTLLSRIEALAPENRKRFWNLCPDFVLELQSHSDRPRKLRNKMKEYIANGAQLGWLLDPEMRSVTIFRPDQEPETRVGIPQIEGEGPIAGFILDLKSVWNPFAA